MNISVNHINLNYGKFNALTDVTFEINNPKIYGLLGRNGAGKTSLLSILASYREASSGSVTINGEQPFENAKVMQQVAFLYKKDFKEETDTVKGMLQDAARYRPNFDQEYADYLVKKFKLDTKKPIKKFSTGMQSALNVVLGLSIRTPITIFDEVYLGMDAPSRDIFYKELLADQERHPRVIILSTHLVSEMEYLFDEVIMLEQGKILLHEDYDSLMTKGYKITGNTETVDNFVRNKQQINVEQLGSTKAVTIYEELSEKDLQTARQHGLDTAPISLHELFVHLTREEE